MPNWCDNTRQIDARLDQESYGSRIPSRAKILRAVIMHGVPPKGLGVQIKETHTSRTIALRGCSEWFLLETRWKKMLEIYFSNRNLVIKKEYCLMSNIA